MHKNMKVNQCSGSQTLQVVQFVGSVGAGVRDKTRLLGRARPRRVAMLHNARQYHRKVLIKQGIDLCRQACGEQSGSKTGGKRTG